MRKPFGVAMLLLALALAISATSLVLGQEANAQSVPGERKVYVIPFSHLDRFWAGTGEECLERGNRVIAKAIQIAKEHPDFRFFLESNNFVDNFIESHQGTQEDEDFKKLVREGRIEVAPEWAGIFQELPPGEVLARNLLYGEAYARSELGVSPQVESLTDIPGFSPQFPQLLREAGIPFLIMTRMGPRDKSVLNWEAPDGSKVLVWNDLYGYCWGAQLDSPDITSVEKRARLQHEIERVAATTPGPLLMSSGCDLWAPTADLMSNLASLNQELPGDHFLLATPQTFFQRIADTAGLPTLRGEVPFGWPMAGVSVLNLWQLDVPATQTLLNAEKFAAINDALGYAPYPRATFDFLWRRLITSMDHNHDGQGGRIGDETKKIYSDLAIERGGLILRKRLRNIAERVRIPIPKSVPIVVFNSTGWKRDDIVKTHVTLYGDVVPGRIDEFKKGMRLVDEAGRAIPFQVVEYSENVSRALQLIFIARDVPSLGYKTYFLEAAAQPETFPLTSEVQLDEGKDLKDPRRPLSADAIENRFYRVTVDKTTGGVTVFDRELNREVTKDMEIAAQEERGSHYVGPVFLTGRTLFASVQGTALEENNSVRTVLRIDEQMDGIPIIQRLTLYNGLKRLDIENRIEWRRGRRLNIQQLIPLEQAHPEFDYGVAFGANASNNVMPGTGPTASDEIQRALWEKYREIHGWIFGGTRDWGVTLAADHPIVELDPQVIRADMIRGTGYTSVKVVRGGEVTSMEYPPTGLYVFRYSLTSGEGDWKTSRSYEPGENLNNPLMPVEVVDDLSPKSLPPTQSFCSVQSDDLVISALKKAETGNSIILRLYEIQGKKAETPVLFLGKQATFRETNLLERDSTSTNERLLRVEPFKIKTLRLSP